jgi:hypothetical protein
VDGEDIPRGKGTEQKLDYNLGLGAWSGRVGGTAVCEMML